MFSVLLFFLLDLIIPFSWSSSISRRKMNKNRPRKSTFFIITLCIVRETWRVFMRLCNGFDNVENLFFLICLLVSLSISNYSRFFPRFWLRSTWRCFWRGFCDDSKKKLKWFSVRIGNWSKFDDPILLCTYKEFFKRNFPSILVS